jgi:hypothetical protein
MGIIHTVKNLFYSYYEQLMTWFRGLSDVGQFGVIAAAIVIIFLVFAMIMISRATKR